MRQTSRRIIALALLAFFLQPAGQALAAEFALEIAYAGFGSGEVECEIEGTVEFFCEPEYEAGTVVTLIPTAEAGSEFAGWSGDCSGFSSCVLTMSKDHSVTATFEEETLPEPEFTLSVAKAGSGSGTVTSSPTGIDCGGLCAVPFVEGIEVTLSATAAAGSAFAGWSGAGCSGTEPCEVRMDGPRGVTATFEAVAGPPPPAAGTVGVAPSAQVRSGKAQLKLTCKGEGPCKGSVRLTAKIRSGGKTKSLLIGKAPFSLAAGAKSTLKIKLSGPAKQALAKGRHGTPLKAKVSGSGVLGSTVTLKPPKK